MLGDVAKALSASGHSVTVLSSPSSYTGSVDNSEVSDAIEVRHLFTLGEKRRLVSWVAFLVQAWMRIPLMRWDRCVFLTDPPFLGALSILLRPVPRIHRRLLWWTMDLYPEILVASKHLNESAWLYKVMRRINGAIVRRMGGFILLGECQLERMRDYPTWRNEDFIIVPPWDNRPIQKVEKENNRFTKEYGLLGRKVALYAGNLGEGHTFEQFAEAARVLARSGREDWVLVFVVRGSKKKRLSEAVDGLDSILVLDYQPQEWTSDLLSSADVHLISMSASGSGCVVPSKLYGVLQTDAPVLFIGPPGADTAREIERYKAGESLPVTCSGEDVVEAIDRLCDQAAIGARNRIKPDRSGPDRIAAFITE